MLRWIRDSELSTITEPIVQNQFLQVMSPMSKSSNTSEMDKSTTSSSSGHGRDDQGRSVVAAIVMIAPIRPVLLRRYAGMVVA